MRTPETFPNKEKPTKPVSDALRTTVTALAIIGSCFLWGGVTGQAAPSGPDDEPGVEVLTRGPVHEAFAGIVAFNPEPGVVVSAAPPEDIEELPPEERPEGSNVAWIPGYWAWDDERDDFLWVSGVWRALPPGRQWMAGYWAKSRQGFQWTSGYWADAATDETIYLPPPPATLEEGPNIAAPSVDFGWTPGCWVWYRGRYAWRPGYWVAGRPDWDWCPAYYVWTPRGYVFVDGYWDYSVRRRGVLFAPVYFESRVYARRGYSYSPSIVIDLGLFFDHLFLRPRYHHYYFGDYYATSYSRAGFYASYSFHSRRYGYDPIYAHQRWEHRHDRRWERQVRTRYEHRRDHEEARPPRTWASQQSIRPTASPADRSRVVATSLAQLSKRTDNPVPFQPVVQAEKQQIARRRQEVGKSRAERRTLETQAVEPSAPEPGRQSEPSIAKRPRSPIIASSPDQLGKGRAPPRPPKTPTPDLKARPKPAAATPDADLNRHDRRSASPRSEDRGKPVPAMPKPKPETTPPGQRQAIPELARPDRAESPPAAERPAKHEAKPESGRPARDKQDKSDKGGTNTADTVREKKANE